MSPDEGDHGDVLFVLGLAGKLAELKWYQNVRSLLTPASQVRFEKNTSLTVCSILWLHCSLAIIEISRRAG